MVEKHGKARRKATKAADRSPSPSTMDYLRHYATLSRFEFLPAISVAILIGMFLGASSFWALLEPKVLLIIVEGLIIFFLLFNTGFMVNCWADWKVDETYKTHLSDSVKAMGRTTVGYVVALHIALALLLSVHVTMFLEHKPFLLVLIMLGIFFGVAYSVEPFRFKTRGPLHSIMAFPVFSVPGLYAYFLVNDASLVSFQNLLFYLLVFGITAAHYALVLISQTEDHPDDKAAGIVTPAVHWGVNNTVDKAFRLNVFGNASSILCFLFILPYYGGPMMLGLLAVLVPAFSFSTYQLWSLRQVAMKGDPKRTLGVIRSRMKAYPMWHAVPLGAVMLVSLILLLVRTFL